MVYIMKKENSEYKKIKKVLTSQEKIVLTADRIMDEVICFQCDLEDYQYGRMREDIIAIIEYNFT